MPPKAVQVAAQRGLDALRDGKGGSGLTDVGRARGKQLAAGAACSEATVRKMHAYFARHAKGDQGQQSKDGTPANTAWLLWGGDAGKRWAASVVKRLDG